MSSSNHVSQLTTSDLERWIQQSGESDFIDAKGPMTWDGKDPSASLAKDIVAFSNSRDGGVLVIGKSETDTGFQFDGLTPEQCASFDTTKVAQWINSKFSPPIYLSCHTQVYNNKNYVVIVVQEFSDIPAICIKNCQKADNQKEVILQKGHVYIRNANASSTPIQTVDEWRMLLGLTTKKHGQELITAFDNLLKGRPLLKQEPNDKDHFDKLEESVTKDIPIVTSTTNQNAGWYFVLRPEKYIERWKRDSLEALVSTSAVRLIDEYPPSSRGTAPMLWGIMNDFYGEKWALTTTGMFIYAREFRENKIDLDVDRIHVTPDFDKNLKGGEWIEFQWSLRTIIEFFVYISRFSRKYEGSENLQIFMKAGPIKGRNLITQNSRINLRERDPCQSPTFIYERKVGATELEANWKELCAECLKEFFDIFPGATVELNTMHQWIDKYLSRQF